MALKTCEMWSECIKIAIFFQKNYKKMSSGWGLRPHAPPVTCLSCTNLLTTSPNFERIEKILTCRSSPSSIANPGYEPNQTPSFWFFNLCLTKSPSFQKLLMTSLHDLQFSPPLLQSPGYAYALNHVQYAYQIPVVASWYCWRTFTSSCLQHCKDAKQQNIRFIAFSLKFLWCRRMECNMEENFRMEWNMEENLVWNGRF